MQHIFKHSMLRVYTLVEILVARRLGNLNQRHTITVGLMEDNIAHCAG